MNVVNNITEKLLVQSIFSTFSIFIYEKKSDELIRVVATKELTL